MVIRRGYSVFYISIAKMTVWGMYSLFIVVFTCKFIVSNKRQLLGYLAELFLPAVVTLLLIFCLALINVNRLVISFLFLVAYVPIILVANKRLNLASIVKEFSDRDRTETLAESEGI